MKQAMILALAAGMITGGAGAQQMALRSPLQGAQIVSVADPTQVKDDLLAGTEKFAAGAKDVSEVNMDSKMLSMVGGKESGDLARKMDFVVVRSYTYDKPGMYRAEDVEVYRKRLEDGSWSCMVHTRDKDGTTDICMRAGQDNETNEMVIMTAEPKELTFVHLRGRMPLSDLGKLNGMGNMGPVPPVPPLQPRKK